ncbi:MAG: hypothetical protein ACRC8S_23115 [Fimbriiglobus sp.]
MKWLRNHVIEIVVVPSIIAVIMFFLVREIRKVREVASRLSDE